MRTRVRISVLLALVVSVLVLSAAGVEAVDNTRYISINGDNANDCTLATPCRTFQRGINATPAGGELRILDSGGYGIHADIGKSMTISGNGNTIYLERAISIDKADAVVALRGLVLSGSSATGIAIGPAAAVHLEGCVVHGFGANGILIYGDGVQVSIVGSVSRDNGYRGLSIDPAQTPTPTTVMIDSSHFTGNMQGGILVGSGNATVTRSTVSSNGGSGITAGRHAVVSVVGTAALRNLRGFVAREGMMTVESSIAQGNRFGVEVSDGGTARLSSSTVTANEIGISNDDGVIETRRNNIVRGNTTDVMGALTPIGGV